MQDAAPEVIELENFCRQLYTTSDPAIRSRAEVSVIELSKKPKCFETCLLLLNRANSSYSLVLAFTTLQKLVTGNTANSQIAASSQQLSNSQKIELRNYVLEYLYKNPKLESFVSQSVIKVDLFIKNIHVLSLLSSMHVHCSPKMGDR